MVKQALMIATGLSIALILGIAGMAYVEQRKEFDNVRQQMEALRAAAETNSALAAKLQEDLTNRQARIEALIKEKEQVSKAQEQMEQQMRTALQSKEVTISELQGKLTVNILDKVLFDSGEADLKPEGQSVLSQIAGVLTQHTNKQIYVIGHTDNVPIRASAYSRYTSNWELSTARATAAVKYLTETGGVDPSRLAAVGYGEFHPVADNSTPEGRAKNRRIAVVILPEQFNPFDVIQTNTQTVVETNMPVVLQAPEE